jgi:hypothetical protein
MPRLVPLAAGAAAALLAIAAAPALAQSARQDPGGTSAAPTSGTRQPGDRTPSRSPRTALDRGPWTPEANRAFMGGGVILEGAPGAPAPAPQALPPGTTASPGTLVVPVR